MSTSAIRDGDRYVVNGSKTFITNGINADLVITAVKTDPSQRHAGMSLLVLERGMDGFERGRNLEKIGQHAGHGRTVLLRCVGPRREPPRERGRGLHPARAQPAAGAAVHRGRRGGPRGARLDARLREGAKAFGQPIGSFQNTRFVLAEVATELEIAQSFIDRCVLALNAGTLTAEDAAMAKWWCTELQKRSVDRCLQLFGGYGYMLEYPIARLRRRPHHHHLRRHDGDHEGDRRQAARA